MKLTCKTHFSPCIDLHNSHVYGGQSWHSMPTVSAADLCHKNFHIDIGQWKWAVPPLCLELWNLRGRESGKQPRLQTNGRRWWRQSFGERNINHSWIEESACRLIKKKWAGLVWTGLVLAWSTTLGSPVGW